mmetsp:Transcript_137896/g.384539  ORF Transcript_137896/g.384539 Transcript_137896/m.384539 type:complete len:205 (+) Transcript_137896:754-1368(+)
MVDGLQCDLDGCPDGVVLRLELHHLQLLEGGHPNLHFHAVVLEWACAALRTAATLVVPAHGRERLDPSLGKQVILVGFDPTIVPEGAVVPLCAHALLEVPASRPAALGSCVCFLWRSGAPTGRSNGDGHVVGRQPSRQPSHHRNCGTILCSHWRAEPCHDRRDGHGSSAQSTSREADHAIAALHCCSIPKRHGRPPKTVATLPA